MNKNARDQNTFLVNTSKIRKKILDGLENRGKDLYNCCLVILYILSRGHDVFIKSLWNIVVYGGVGVKINKVVFL